MMTAVSFLVFAAALAGALSVFGFTLVPALPRIRAILRGEVDPVFAARPVLTVNEPRVRSRIRLATPAPHRVALRAVA
jgi:hypothetical protein